jgi:site-specific recombinase XerD
MGALAQVSVDTRPAEVIIRDMITLDRAIDDFLSDCRARGWSERSITSYAATLHRFADRLPKDLDVSKITPDDLRRYRASRQRQLSRNTIAHEDAHLSSWLGWLYRNGKTNGNPMDKLERTKRTPSDELEVVSVATVDVRKLLEEARPGTERNTLSILAYLGPRRHAVAMLKLSDYDQREKTIRFREKGSKTIVKPVPDELASILDASIAAGEILPAPDDYLVPPEGYLHRPGERDDRVIWRVVKKVAERVHVEAHVHSLRAAFAVFYLEMYPDDLIGLKDQLGHRSLSTTLIYLRRRDRQAGMERVRDLSWVLDDDGQGGIRTHSALGNGFTARPGSPTPAPALANSEPSVHEPGTQTPLVASTVLVPQGPEPPSADSPPVGTTSTERLPDALLERLNQAVPDDLLQGLLRGDSRPLTSETGS